MGAFKNMFSDILKDTSIGEWWEKAESLMETIERDAKIIMCNVHGCEYERAMVCMNDYNFGSSHRHYSVAGYRTYRSCSLCKRIEVLDEWVEHTSADKIRDFMGPMTFADWCKFEEHWHQVEWEQEQKRIYTGKSQWRKNIGMRIRTSLKRFIRNEVLWILKKSL